MTRSRSMLWLSLALLLLGAGLLVPDLLFNRTAAPRTTYTVRPSTGSGASSSASLIDPRGSDASRATPAPDDAAQRLDVRGNEISRPVARYRVDETGSMYEVHSPQTEVPRLKAPVM